MDRKTLYSKIINCLERSGFLSHIISEVAIYLVPKDEKYLLIIANDKLNEDEDELISFHLKWSGSNNPDYVMSVLKVPLDPITHFWHIKELDERIDDCIDWIDWIHYAMKYLNVILRIKGEKDVIIS